MRMRMTPMMAGAVLLATVVYSQAVTSPLVESGRDFPGVVFVTSQGLYYDTFVAAEELPPRGRFQLLVEGETEYGPGDPGYLGGRWKVPDDDGGYDYFLCPLIPPGRPTP